MELKLPLALVSRFDVTRAQRELTALDDFFISANARKAGAPLKVPRTSYTLEQLSQLNQYNLLQEPHRKDLKSKLESLNKAPSVHISFASEPSPKVIDSILGWLRSNIHSQILLRIGLQPSIAAGCVLRTPNKIFDMSLQAQLKDQEGYMVKLIQGAVSARQR